MYNHGITMMPCPKTWNIFVQNQLNKNCNRSMTGWLRVGQQNKKQSNS